MNVAKKANTLLLAPMGGNILLFIAGSSSTARYKQKIGRTAGRFCLKSLLLLLLKDPINISIKKEVRNESIQKLIRTPLVSNLKLFWEKRFLLR